MTRENRDDPNAPLMKIVRGIVLHGVYLALAVAFYFVVDGLGFDVAIHVYFLVVLLIPLVFWLAAFARGRLSRRAGGGAEET